MPDKIKGMLDELIKDGSEEDFRVLAAASKQTLTMLGELDDKMGGMCAHVKDKELHTPKGILVRTKVIGWFVILVFVISTIVMYIPEAIVFLKSLP